MYYFLNDYNPIRAVSEREISQTISVLTAEILHKDRQLFSLSQSRLRRQLNQDFDNTRQFLSRNPSIVVCEADKGHIAIICKLDTLVGLQREHIEAGIRG